MGSKWSSSLESTRPLDESTRFVLLGARRVFASSTNTCYPPSQRPCFSRLIHSSSPVPGWLMVRVVSEAFAVCRSRSLSFSGFYGGCIVFVAKHIREKNRCKKRICDVPDHAYLLTTSSFSPWMYLYYSLLGVTSFVSLYQPLGCPLCSWSRVVSSGETVEILCILLYWNVIPEWKSLFLVLILLFPWRILGFVGWNNSEAGARPLGFLLFYHTATGSTYLTVRVNLGLACFLNLLCCRQKTYLLSPPSVARI